MYNNIKPYPANLILLLTFDGFLSEYYKHLENTDTDKQAYEATEAIHMEYFGNRKYSCWRTFRVIRARNIKK